MQVFLSFGYVFFPNNPNKMNDINQSIPNPSWRGSLSYGWATMKKYFLPFFLIVIVLAIVDAPMEMVRDNISDHPDEWNPDMFWPIGFEILGLAYWLLFVPVIGFGADLLFVQAVRNQRIDVRNIIIGFNNFVTIVLVNLLATALVGMALVAFIIPGIIVACRLAFVSYLVMDKDLDPIAAVETSWKMTRSHGWKIFALGFTSIFIFFGGLLLFFVGVVPAIMWIKSSFASMYEAVLQETDDSLFVAQEANQTE